MPRTNPHSTGQQSWTPATPATSEDYTILLNITNTQNIPTSGQHTSRFVLFYLSKLLVCPVSKIPGGIADPSAGLFAPKHRLYQSTPLTALALITIFAFSTLACLKPHWLCLLCRAVLLHIILFTHKLLVLRAAQCCLCRASSLGMEAYRTNCFCFIPPLLFAFGITHCPIICQERTYSGQDSLIAPTVHQHSSIYHSWFAPDPMF